MFCSVEKTQLYRCIWVLMLNYWVVTFNKYLINTPQRGTQFQVYVSHRFFFLTYVLNFRSFKAVKWFINPSRLPVFLSEFK